MTNIKEIYAMALGIVDRENNSGLESVEDLYTSSNDFKF